MSKLYHYRYVGAAEEHFPEPPIAWTLEPGDEMILDEPVEHPRLQLVEATDPDAPTEPEPGAPSPVPDPVLPPAVAALQADVPGFVVKMAQAAAPESPPEAEAAPSEAPPA